MNSVEFWDHVGGREHSRLTEDECIPPRRKPPRSHSATPPLVAKKPRLQYLACEEGISSRSNMSSECDSDEVFTSNGSRTSQHDENSRATSDSPGPETEPSEPDPAGLEILQADHHLPESYTSDSSLYTSEDATIAASSKRPCWPTNLDTGFTVAYGFMPTMVPMDTYNYITDKKDLGELDVVSWHLHATKFGISNEREIPQDLDNESTVPEPGLQYHDDQGTESLPTEPSSSDSGSRAPDPLESGSRNPSTEGDSKSSKSKDALDSEHDRIDRLASDLEKTVLEKTVRRCLPDEAASHFLNSVEGKLESKSPQHIYADDIKSLSLLAGLHISRDCVQLPSDPDSTTESSSDSEARMDKRTVGHKSLASVPKSTPTWRGSGKGQVDGILYGCTPISSTTGGSSHAGNSASGQPTGHDAGRSLSTSYMGGSGSGQGRKGKSNDGTRDNANDRDNSRKVAPSNSKAEGRECFRLRCQLNAHLPQIFCERVDKKFSRCAGRGWKNMQDVKVHLKKAHFKATPRPKNDLQCTRCQHVFENLEAYVSHDYNADCTIHCAECEEVFDSKSARQAHKQQAHPERDTLSRLIELDENKEKDIAEQLKEFDEYCAQRIRRFTASDIDRNEKIDTWVKVNTEKYTIGRESGTNAAHELGHWYIMFTVLCPGVEVPRHPFVESLEETINLEVIIEKIIFIWKYFLDAHTLYVGPVPTDPGQAREFYTDKLRDVLGVAAVSELTSGSIGRLTDTSTGLGNSEWDSNIAMSNFEYPVPPAVPGSGEQLPVQEEQLPVQREHIPVRGQQLQSRIMTADEYSSGMPGDISLSGGVFMGQFFNPGDGSMNLGP